MSEQDWIERLRERAPINLLRRPMTDAAGANDLWPLLCDVVEAAKGHLRSVEAGNYALSVGEIDLKIAIAALDEALR